MPTRPPRTHSTAGSPTAAHEAATGPAPWWRWLLADLADLALVGGAGVLGAAVAYPALRQGLSQPGFDSLGYALVLVGIGLLAAAAAWVVLLVRAARDRTPGQRAVGVRTGRTGLLGAALSGGRHVGVVATVVALGGLDTLAEPGIEAVVGPAVGLALSAGLVAVLYVRRGWRTAAAAVLAGAALGAAGGLGVPERPPYEFEDEAAAATAVVDELAAAAGARRVCATATPDAAGTPPPGDVFEPCSTTDGSWVVTGSLADVADRVAASAGPASSRAVVVAARDDGPGLEVALEEQHATPIELVVPTTCGTGVAVASGGSLLPVALRELDACTTAGGPG